MLVSYSYLSNAPYTILHPVSHSITSKIRSNAVKLRVTHARTLLSGPQPHPARRPEALKPTPLPRAALLLTRNPPLQPPGPDRPKTPTSHLLLSRQCSNSTRHIYGTVPSKIFIPRNAILPLSFLGAPVL